MEFGKEFWVMLHAMAFHVERSPRGKTERRRRLLNAYLEFGPLGRQAALEEVHLVAAELAALEREMAKVENGVPVTSDGADGQPGR